MFEQSTIAPGSKGKRLWTTCIGLGGQAVLVSVAILAPMVFPQVLPQAVLMIPIAAPGPPPPPPPPPGETVVRPRRSPSTIVHDTVFREPPSIPKQIAIITEEPEPVAQGPGVPGGIPGGVRDGVQGGVLDSIMRSGAVPAAVPATNAPTRMTVDSTTAPPQRLRVGGLVKLGRLVSRVEPKYPRMAVQMHISGEVKIEGVIGTDGRIRELKVMNGHPLLVGAALEAVRQWIYEPSTLNGDRIEVIAPITVTFRLN